MLMPCASMMQNESDAYRKIRLRVEDVQGKNCLTNFWVCHTNNLIIDYTFQHWC